MPSVREAEPISTNLERRSLLREVNERIRDANDTFRVGDVPDTVEVFCECGQPDCLQRLVVSPEIYESVREIDGHFLVAPTHRQNAEVVAMDDAYCVVTLMSDGLHSP